MSEPNLSEDASSELKLFIKRCKDCCCAASDNMEAEVEEIKEVKDDEANDEE